MRASALHARRTLGCVGSGMPLLEEERKRQLSDAIDSCAWNVAEVLALTETEVEAIATSKRRAELIHAARLRGKFDCALKLSVSDAERRAVENWRDRVNASLATVQLTSPATWKAAIRLQTLYRGSSARRLRRWRPPWGVGSVVWMARGSISQGWMAWVLTKGWVGVGRDMRYRRLLHAQVVYLLLPQGGAQAGIRRRPLAEVLPRACLPCKPRGGTAQGAVAVACGAGRIRRGSAARHVQGGAAGGGASANGRAASDAALSCVLREARVV